VNPQSWETFRAVAEAGSIAAAARQLNLSPSAVSQQVQQLEDLYHCQLLVRHRHGVQLTAEGELLYRYAGKLLRTLAESQEQVAALGDASTGRLRIGASFTIAEYVLPPVLVNLYRPEPGDHVSVMMANSEAVCQFVQNQVVDVGLVEAEVLSPLAAQRFYTDEPKVYVAATHPWARRSSITLEEFMAEPMVLREPGSGTRRALERALAEHGGGIEDLKVRLVLGTTEAIKAMVRAGLGATVLSPLTIRPDDADALATVSVEGLLLTRHFYAVHRPVALSPAARRLIHLLSLIPERLA